MYQCRESVFAGMKMERIQERWIIKLPVNHIGSKGIQANDLVSGFRASEWASLFTRRRPFLPRRIRRHRRPHGRKNRGHARRPAEVGHLGGREKRGVPVYDPHGLVASVGYGADHLNRGAGRRIRLSALKNNIYLTQRGTQGRQTHDGRRRTGRRTKRRISQEPIGVKQVAGAGPAYPS